MIKRIVIVLAICCVVWASCTQQRQPCLTPKIASLILETMHITNDTGTIFSDTALPAAVFLPLSGGSYDSLIFPLGSVFTISLSPDSNVCRWVVETDTTSHIFDTLTFRYKANLQFLSNACGYTDFYTLDTVQTTHKFIDSVHIVNSSVTNNVNTKHVQVYIHPDI
jgi:predicted nucleic-acid-binding Zn-ribbon protein